MDVIGTTGLKYEVIEDKDRSPGLRRYDKKLKYRSIYILQKKKILRWRTP